MTATRTHRQTVTYRPQPGTPARTITVAIPAGHGHTDAITDAIHAATGDTVTYSAIIATGPALICRYCDEPVRREGLQLVGTSDDSPACPHAPLRTCTRCQGEGCGSCEDYGQVFGPHATR